MHSRSPADLALEELKQTVAKNVSTARNAAGWVCEDKKPARQEDEGLENTMQSLSSDDAPTWTQEGLAKQTGLSRATVAKIETSNASDISLSTLFKLANAFGIPAFVLLMGRRDWQRIEGLTMLKDRQLIQKLRKLVDERNSEAHGMSATEAMMRIERLSKSESEDEQEMAAMEIDQVVAPIFRPEPVKTDESIAGAPMTPSQDMKDEKTEQVIEIPRRIAAAIGAYMLPSIPFLNAVITGSVTIPFEKLLTKSKQG